MFLHTAKIGIYDYERHFEAAKLELILSYILRALINQHAICVKLSNDLHVPPLVLAMYLIISFLAWVG